MSFFAKAKDLAHAAAGGATGCDCPPELIRAGGCHCDFLDPSSDPPVQKTK